MYKFEGLFEDFGTKEELLTKPVSAKDLLQCPHCSEGVLTPTFLSFDEYMFLCKRKVKKRRAKEQAKPKLNEVSASYNVML